MGYISEENYTIFYQSWRTSSKLLEFTIGIRMDTFIHYWRREMQTALSTIEPVWHWGPNFAAINSSGLIFWQFQGSG